MTTEPVFALNIELARKIPIDCGPLTWKEFGVVFQGAKQGKIKMYFIKGKAHILCPCIMEKQSIEGYEYDLCREYAPPYKHECESIKELVIKDCEITK